MPTIVIKCHSVGGASVGRDIRSGRAHSAKTIEKNHFVSNSTFYATL